MAAVIFVLAISALTVTTGAASANSSRIAADVQTTASEAGNACPASMTWDGTGCA